MPEDHIQRIYRLLGSRVVLLPVPLGRKSPVFNAWPHTTFEQTQTDNWQRKLRKGNVGVLAVEGLVALDCDEDYFMEEMLDLNPSLGYTLRTRGNRAGTFWIKLGGDYPAKVKNLFDSRNTDEKGNPLKVGEWRGAQQTIIHGKHPKGVRYRFVSEAVPVFVTFEGINWPEWLKGPRNYEEEALPMQHSNTVTQSPRHAVTQSLRDPVHTDTHVVSGVGCVLVDVSLFLPTALDQNNALLFNMARAVLAQEVKLGRQATGQELIGILKDWYSKNAFLDPNNTFDDYWIEFQRAVDCAKVPAGSNTLTYALDLASRRPLPEVALQFTDPGKQRLVAVLWQMHLLRHPKPFYITCRDAAAIPGVNANFTTVHRWLQAFCSDRTGFMVLARSGSLISREGNEYLFKDATLQKHTDHNHNP